MMERIDQKDWRCFHLGEIYSVSRPRTRRKDDYEPGNVPFVASGSANNGVMKYCEPKENESLDTGDCITVSPVDGSAFYQPIDFLGRGGAGSSVLILRRNGETKETGVFIARSIQQTCSKYTYGHMGNTDSISREQIMLPVTVSGEPDYNYMTAYVQTQWKALLEKYKAYVEQRIAELGDYSDVPSLVEKKWGPISLTSVFDIVRGKENNMAMLDDGDIPLVSARNTNNGVKGFVKASKEIFEGNCITLNNDGDGGAGLAFYQPADMALDTHVTALVPKNNISKWSMIFIAECVSCLHGFFGHGLSISNKRANIIKVMLPVNDIGEPDCEYMEQYTKNMMLRKYEQYLNYLDRTQKGI